MENPWMDLNFDFHFVCFIFLSVNIISFVHNFVCFCFLFAGWSAWEYIQCSPSCTPQNHMSHLQPLTGQSMKFGLNLRSSSMKEIYCQMVMLSIFQCLTFITMRHWNFIILLKIWNYTSLWMSRKCSGNCLDFFLFTSYFLCHCIHKKKSNFQKI